MRQDHAEPKRVTPQMNAPGAPHLRGWRDAVSAPRVVDVAVGRVGGFLCCTSS